MKTETYFFVGLFALLSAVLQSSPFHPIISGILFLIIAAATFYLEKHKND